MVEPVKGFCPSCEEETDLEHVQQEEPIILNGISIMVHMDYFRCLRCGEEFDDPRPGNDPVAEAFEKYRKLTGTEYNKDKA